jgi:hypothetical protein
MRPYALHLVVLSLLLGALPARAADLAKIERAVAREPKYQGKPKYCLLVFGPEVKFRVWLVLDGTTLYVDRDGSGDLTQPAKRVTATYYLGRKFGFQPGQLATPDGKNKYNLSQLRVHDGSCDMTLHLGDGRNTRAGFEYLAGFDGPGSLRFADRPQDAPIIHFAGPLTLQRFEPQPESQSPDLVPGPLVCGRSTELAFSLGTPGLGNGTFAKYRFEGKGPKAAAEIRFGDGKTTTVNLEPDG